ncbi:MAG: hypothetical protein EPO02_06145 [Nitrospirae bacterium]|nr:MAG: hypothetical protein EPO02_06145 [Nitrospirota bacterium]
MMELRHAPVAAARCRHLTVDGARSVITLPSAADDARWTADLLHELGHALFTAGMGSLLRQGPDVRHQRLAALWDLEDEARARRFALAWLLPAALVDQFRRDPEELIHRSGCAEALVAVRLSQVTVGRSGLVDVPAWSAARHYRVLVQGPPAPALLVTAAAGGARYLLPAPVELLPDLALQVQADLVALTAAEWACRHEPDRLLPSQPMELDFAVIRKWAAAG